MIFQEGAMSSSVRVSISRQERIPATGAVQGTGPPEIQEPETIAMKPNGSRREISWEEMITGSNQVKWGGLHDFGNHGWFSALFTDESSNGSIEGHFFRSGMMIFLIDLYVDKDVEITSERHEPVLGFGLIVQGSCRRTFGDRKGRYAEMSLQAGLNVAGRYHGRTSVTLAGGHRHKLVNLKIKREYFPRLIEEYATDLLPSAGQELLFSDFAGLVFQKKLSPCLECLAHQVIGCSYEGLARRLFMEAKTLEMLACQIEELSERIPQDSALRETADVERIHQAREILEKQFAEPPTLVALARHVGLNDFKLKRGFREVLGTTVFGYVRKLRMEKARQLLETSDMSVTQVALSVGYNSFSHFTTAFKKSVGVVPSRYRRARMRQSEQPSLRYGLPEPASLYVRPDAAPNSRVTMSGQNRPDSLPEGHTLY
jgi:AraC family transcriptional activator of pyochelin receptor